MPDEVRIRARHGDLTVEARVDPATHRVLELTGDVQPPTLLDALSRASVGHTVQDVSEHAVIRAEVLMRGSGPRPVPGVVQPENAGPQYTPLLILARGLLKDYQAKTAYHIQPNFEEGPVHQASSEWGTSTVPERTRRILSNLPAACPETGIRAADVSVKALQGPRVTLGFSAQVPAEAQQRYLTRTEALLRREVDPRLELFLDDRRDANVKRHGRDV